MTIGIVGLGYVGLPLAVAFAEEGQDVIAVDIDHRKVDGTRGRGVLHRGHPRRTAARGAADRISRHDALRGRCGTPTRSLICVPTPLTPNREPDLGPLLDSAPRPGRRPARRASSSCSSRRPTPAPRASGSCRCSRSPGSTAGRDFHLAFSPERVDPGRTDFTLRTTPKVVGGLTEACGDRAEALYERVCDTVVRVGSPEAAEMAKLLENIFRSVNIALVNELAMLADRMGIDIWEVVDAAATQAVRLHALRAGPGHGRPLPAGRPLLPLLAAREFDMTTEFIELAGKINQQMPYFCVERRSSARSTTRASRSGARGS